MRRRRPRPVEGGPRAPAGVARGTEACHQRLKGSRAEIVPSLRCQLWVLGFSNQSFVAENGYFIPVWRCTWRGQGPPTPALAPPSQPASVTPPNKSEGRCRPEKLQRETGARSLPLAPTYPNHLWGDRKQKAPTLAHFLSLSRRTSTLPTLRLAQILSQGPLHSTSLSSQCGAAASAKISIPGSSPRPNHGATPSAEAGTSGGRCLAGAAPPPSAPLLRIRFKPDSRTGKPWGGGAVAAGHLSPPPTPARSPSRLRCPQQASTGRRCAAPRRLA
jgi:hypothetical protein